MKFFLRINNKVHITLKLTKKMECSIFSLNAENYMKTNRFVYIISNDINILNYIKTKTKNSFSSQTVEKTFLPFNLLAKIKRVKFFGYSP